MSTWLLVLIGVLLCFLGAWSTRIVVLAGGFAAGWLLADALGASTATTLLVAAAGAVGTFVITLLVSKFLLFVTGCVIGAVVGARLFVLLDQGEDPNWLLAVVFVPAIAVLCGFLAQKFQRRFVMWGTAFAGSGLILSGLGRLDESVDFLRRPDEPAGVTGYTLLWVALAVLGQRVQRRALRDKGD
jgi:hypothetical protein